MDYSLVKIFGILNFVLIIFQLTSGFRIIKVSPRIHRAGGIALLVSTLSHVAMIYLAGI